MGNMNVKNLQNNINLSVYMKNFAQWKAKTGNQNASFVLFLDQSGINVKNLVNDWNTSLEGNDGDDTNNALSLDRYFESNGNIFFQTQDGNIVTVDNTNGKVASMSQSDFLAYANSAGSFGQTEVEDDSLVNNNIDMSLLDRIDFENNSFSAVSYVFGANQTAYDAMNSLYDNFRIEAVDVSNANGVAAMQKIISSVVADEGKFSSLEEIFGNQQDNAANGSVKTTFIDDTTMTVENTDGRLYVVKYNASKGTVTSTALSTATSSKYSNVTTADLSTAAGVSTFTSTLKNMISTIGGYSNLENGLKDILGADSNVTFSKDNNTVYIQQNGETYILNYDDTKAGDAKISMKSYSFDTDGNNSKDSAISTKLDLTTDAGKSSVVSVLNNSVTQLGKFAGFENVFGDNKGSAENHFYSADGKNMVVVQNGRAMIVSYNETADASGSHFSVSEITKDNIKNYKQQFGLTDEQIKTMTGLTFSIQEATANGKTNYSLGVSFTYGTNNTAGSGSSSGSTSLSGDPHFAYNGGQAFDLQGAGGGADGTYKLLEGNGFSLTADFTSYVDNENYATGMSKETLSITIDEGTISVVNNSSGTVISLNGKTITADEAANYGVTITTNGTTANITFNDKDKNKRQITLIGSTYGQAISNYIAEGETGLLTQAKGAKNENEVSDTDLNQVLVFSTGAAMSAPVVMTEGQETKAGYNELAADLMTTLKRLGSGYLQYVMTGAIDSKDTTAVDYSYNPDTDNVRTTAQKASYLAKIALAAVTSGSSKAQDYAALWIEYSNKSMEEDISTSENISLSNKFEEGHGYSRSQWNEYVGTVVFGTEVDANKDGKKDKAIDMDNDGVTDGYDLDGDGALSESEMISISLKDIFKTTQSASFSVSI